MRNYYIFINTATIKMWKIYLKRDLIRKTKTIKFKIKIFQYIYCITMHPNLTK